MHGPFQGVVGFSQGACLAGILCAQRVREPETAAMPDLTFGLLFAGFLPRDGHYSALFDGLV